MFVLIVLINILTCNIAFGAASKPANYPVIYGFFTISGITALFKSEDVGTSWVMISDAEHGFGAASGNVVGAEYVFP
jgi:xyloglucan-specific exo-beta-1,4-glucanase